MDTMDLRIRASSGCDESLCDTTETCSGDTDDVCSLCSWTTDQGEFEYHNPVADLAASQDAGSLPWGGLQESLAHDAPSTTGCMPVAMVPVPIICYVAMPTTANEASWPEADMMQCERWPQHSLLCQDQSYAPGTWDDQHVPQYSNNSPVAGCRSVPRKQGNANQVRRSGRPSAQRTKPRKNFIAASRPENQGGSETEATTVILRNLPIEVTRDMLLKLLDREGFSGGYDFLHMPIDFQTKTGLGYAIVNLVSHNIALCIHKHFEGFSNWPCLSDHLGEVAWNTPHQGLATHIDRYRSSPLMHPSVPEIYRPVLFENGIRIEFPAPTSRVRAPRIRHQKPGTSLTV